MRNCASNLLSPIKSTSSRTSFSDWRTILYMSNNVGHNCRGRGAREKEIKHQFTRERHSHTRQSCRSILSSRLAIKLFWFKKTTITMQHRKWKELDPYQQIPMISFSIGMSTNEGDRRNIFVSPIPQSSRSSIQPEALATIIRHENITNATATAIQAPSVLKTCFKSDSPLF